MDELGTVIINLPYPPTVNHYWGQRGKIRFLTAKAKKFRADVLKAVVENKVNKNLGTELIMRVDLFPPDRRKRDIDNTLKPILDALEHADVYVNDSQIVELHVYKHKFESKDKSNATIVLGEKGVAFF